MNFQMNTSNSLLGSILVAIGGYLIAQSSDNDRQRKMRFVALAAPIGGFAWPRILGNQGTVTGGKRRSDPRLIVAMLATTGIAYLAGSRLGNVKP